MMKIAPVSADLLVKLAIGGAALLALAYVVNRGARSISGAIDAVVGLPGRALDAVTGAAQAGGAAWQDQYSANPAPTIGNPSGYGGKYTSPMVNDQGMDFSQFGG